MGMKREREKEDGNVKKKNVIINKMRGIQKKWSK